MNKRIGVYLRVSTQDQSTELQRSELLAYIKQREWDLFEIYEDKATGTNNNRPMLKKLLKDAKSKKFDIVLCWKIDRFARSLKDLLTMLQELKESEVNFVSLKDQIDLTTAAGMLMFQLIGAFGEFEASVIKERVIAGLRNAQSKGIVLGRPLKKGHSVVAKMRSEGKTVKEIAVHTGLSTKTVYKTLAKGA